MPLYGAYGNALLLGQWTVSLSKTKQCQFSSVMSLCMLTEGLPKHHTSPQILTVTLCDAKHRSKV